VNAGKRKVGINAGAVMCVSAFFLMPAAPGTAAGAVLSRQDHDGDRWPGARRVGRFAAEFDITVFEKAFPGQPNIVTEYMTGGGDRKAANYIYRIARPDGLTLEQL
jgi:hypothetical protein